ncbi:MAG: pirin family protein [Deltaproteobacteria bacterium]|nr:pirin family protein [Deltaproteobacteria bacterium]
MVLVRRPEEIFQIDGAIQDGTFHGRWHFSFDGYYDKEFARFGTLRVLNDDTLSPGAVWPLHPHHDIEVVTYCAQGEFRHADERGRGGVLKKGWVQHTTVGEGMWHSEINNLKDAPMRFIQIWFYPSKKGLMSTVEQKAVDRSDRTDQLLPIVSPSDPGALFIFSDARVYSSFLKKGIMIDYKLEAGRGAYLYVIEGGPVEVNGKTVSTLGAALLKDEPAASIKAGEDSELLLVDVNLREGGS